MGDNRNGQFLLKSYRGLYHHEVNKHGRAGLQGYVFSSYEACGGCVNGEVNIKMSTHRQIHQLLQWLPYNTTIGFNGFRIRIVARRLHIKADNGKRQMPSSGIEPATLRSKHHVLQTDSSDLVLPASSALVQWPCSRCDQVPCGGRLYSGLACTRPTT